MKMNYSLPLASLFLSSIFISCGDDDKVASPTPVVKDTTEYFTCKLNNVNFVDETRFSDYYLGTTRIVSHNEHQLIRIDFNKDTVGTYTFVTNSTENVLSYLDQNSKEYNSISGSLTVTEYNKSEQIISGTFSGILKCTADNTQIVVTDGKFNHVELLPF